MRIPEVRTASSSLEVTSGGKKSMQTFSEQFNFLQPAARIDRIKILRCSDNWSTQSSCFNEFTWITPDRFLELLAAVGRLVFEVCKRTSCQTR